MEFKNFPIISPLAVSSGADANGDLLSNETLSAWQVLALKETRSKFNERLPENFQIHQNLHTENTDNIWIHLIFQQKSSVLPCRKKILNFLWHYAD